MIPDPRWTVRYWQWVLSNSRPNNPLVTGRVNDDVFLALPCTGGGEDCNRILNLSGMDRLKDILIPVYCAEYSTAEIPHLNPTVQNLLQSVRDDVTSPIDMECVVDGSQLESHYIETSPFEISVPDNNLLDENPPKGTYLAIAAGYWHKLSPLAVGRHVVRFGGTGRNGFHTKVQYTINVFGG